MASGFNLTAQLNLRGPSNIPVIVADIKKQIGSISADINFKLDPNAAKNTAALNSSLTNLNKTLGQTTVTASSAAAALKTLAASISSVKADNLSQNLSRVSTTTTKVSQSMSQVSRNISTASSEMVEFGKQSGLAIRRFAAFSTVTGAVYGITNAINQGIRAYIDYDRQLIKLQQVTGQSANGLKSLEQTITQLATGLGVGSSELTEISSTLAQAGLSARDTERALKALALSSLAPSFDSMNETVEGSIALMRQFDISASDLEKALGSVNSVAAKFAVEASDLITAIQRTGGVFATASRGVSEGTDALNEFLAVFTSIRATTRESAETIATGLRTIFTRIQRGDTIQALKEYGVNLTDLDGKFVGAYKAVELLSNGLSSIDTRDLRFSKIVEELGGFRQIGKVIPLIQQFATAQEALGVAQTGQGSLAADAAKAQGALAVQITKVREEFLALFRDIGKSDSFQAIAKGALSLTSALIKTADSIKGVIPVLGVMLAFKGAAAITQFGTGFLGGVRGAGGARGVGNRMGSGSGGMNSGGAVRRYATGGLVPGSGDLDSVDARLTPGEFVMSKPAVKAIGAGNLHALNRNSGGAIKRFANAGTVAGAVRRVRQEERIRKSYDMPAITMNVEESTKKSKEFTDSLPDDAIMTWKKYPGAKELAHFGSDSPLTPSQFRKYISRPMRLNRKKGQIEENRTIVPRGVATKSKKILPSLKAAQDTLDISDINSANDAQIQSVINELGIFQKAPILLSVPKRTNQAMRATGGGAYSRELASWIRSNPTELLSGTRRNPDRIKSQDLVGDPKQFANRIAKNIPSKQLVKDSDLSSLILDIWPMLSTDKQKYLASRADIIWKRVVKDDRFGIQERHEGSSRIDGKLLTPQPRKSLGGFIQKFEVGGPAVEPVSTTKKSTTSEIIKLLGLETAAKVGGISANEVYTTLNKRTPTPQQAASKAAILAEFTKKQNRLSGAKEARTTRITSKGLLFGAAGMLGSAFSPINKKIVSDQLKAPVDVRIVSGIMDPAVASSVEESFTSSINKASSKAAKKVMISDILAKTGLGKELNLDFDRTLAFGADKILSDPKTPKFAEFGDRNKVSAALKGAKLSLLGKELAGLVSSKPELLGNLKLITARPASTLDLVQGWLANKGLPIPLSQFKGLGGPGVSGSQIAKLKAALLSPGSLFVDDDSRNIKAAKARSKEGIQAYRYGNRKISGNANAEATAQGILFEKMIQKLGGPGALKGQGMDFPQGLKGAAKYFGIPANIATDAKRTISGPSTVEDNIITYLKVRGYKLGGMLQKFAVGGSAQPKDTLEEYFTDAAPINLGLSNSKTLSKSDRKNLASDVRNLRQLRTPAPEELYSSISRNAFDKFAMDTGLNKSPDIPKDTKFNNRQTYYAQEVAKIVGKVFNLPGFMSTSKNYTVAKSFLDNAPRSEDNWAAMLTVKTKKNAQGVDVAEQLKDRKINVTKEDINPRTGKTETFFMKQPHEENEFMLSPRSRFRVDRAKYVDLMGRHNLWADVQQYADGGTVPALVSNGEAYIPPEVAKSIGYGKLQEMNQADRNGMDKFSRGGISVFRGPGSGTSDSIGPIGLPVGSFILREKATKALGLSSGGSVQRFATGGGLPLRPESIQSSTVSINDNAVNALKNLQKVIEGLGLTSTRIASLLMNASAVSYKAAEKVAQAELDRVKSAGGSIDQIIASENALAAIRDAKNKDVGKRNTLESVFGSVAGKSSGQVQEQIINQANMEADRKIKAKEASLAADKPAREAARVEQEKELIVRKKEEDFKKIEKDLTAEAMAKATPLTPVNLTKIQQEASKQVLSKSSTGGYDLTPEEKETIRKRTVGSDTLSDEQKKSIYEKSTIRATTKFTGKSQTELEASGIGANDIRAYAQQSQMDRKTLRDMDKQLVAMRMEEYRNAGTVRGIGVSSAAKARELAEKEINERRKLVNQMAKEQGLAGPGSNIFSYSGRGTVGGAFGGIGDRMVGGVRQGISNVRSNISQYGILGAGARGIGSMGSAVGGQGGFLLSMGVGMLAGQGENIAAGLGGNKETQAKRAAGIEAFGSTMASGLSLASGAAMIPVIGPAIAGITLLGTTALATSAAFKASAQAQKEYQDTLKAKKAEEANDILSRSLRDLAKDVNNIDLQNSVRSNIKNSVEANAATSRPLFEEQYKDIKDKRISQMSTGEYIGSFFTGMPEVTSKDLGKEDYDTVARKMAPRFDTASDAALLDMEREIKTGTSIDKLATDEAFKPLREAIARAKPEVLAQIIQIEQQLANAKDDATRNELMQRKESIITENTRNSKILENMKKTDDLNKAMDAASKAGRQVAITFGNMTRAFEQSIGRASFEMDSLSDAADFAIDALGGSAKVGFAKSKDLNVLQNPSAYSEKERNETSQRVSRRMYNPDAAGLTPEEKDRRTSQAEKVEQLLNFDANAFSQRAAGAGNALLSGKSDANFQEVSKAVEDKISADIKGLPEQVQEEIKKKFIEIRTSVDKEKDSENDPKAKVNALLAKVQDELANSASKAAEDIRKMSLEYENTMAKALDRFANATNRATDAQIKAAEFRNKAQDIRTESDINLRELSSGGSIGLDERASIVNNRVARLTGGVTDPTQIRQNIEQKGAELTSRRNDLEAKMSDPKLNDADRKKITEEAGADMAKLSTEIRNNEQALSDLANSADLAAAAMNQLQKVQAMQADRLANIDRILTSTPQELRKFNESLIRVQQRANGINPGPSREARRVYNQTLRQTGGNRRAANQAAYGQMAQDRATDLQTMNQFKSQYVLNQMNQGMSEEAANNLFNRNAANVRGQMTYESGAINIPGVANGIMASVDPRIDPAYAKAEQIYKQATERQARANEEQAALETSKSLLSLQSASATLSIAFTKLSEILAKIDLEALGNVGVKVAGKEPDPVAKASGGVVYASIGKMIDFKPKGTDTVPAMLTPGEFVVNARATAQHLPLLKAINSGNDIASVSGRPVTMSRGGVVYLSEGGTARRREDIEAEMSLDTFELQSMNQQLENQRQTYTSSEDFTTDKQEVEKLRSERKDAQRESRWYEAGGDSNRAASNHAMSQVGETSWRNMTPEQQNEERDKYLPEFNQIQNDYDQKRKDKGYESGSIASANFFNQQKKEKEDRVSSAVGAEVNKMNEVVNKMDETPEQRARRSELESRQAQNRTNVRDMDFLDGRERKGNRFGIGNDDYGVGRRAAEMAGLSSAEYDTLSIYPGVLTGAKPPPEVQARIDQVENNKEAATQQLKEEARVRLSQQNISIPGQAQQPSGAAAQQSQQANDAKQKAETQKQEQQTSATTTQTQQPQFKMTDVQMYAQQAAEKAPRELKDFPKPRSAAEVGMYREGLNRGMTIAEIKNERQQAYLSRFNPETKANKEKSMKQSGEYASPSERQALTSKAMEAATKQAKGGDPYADQKSGAAQAQEQAQQAKDKAKTDATAQQAEQSDKEGPKPLLDSTMTADEQSTYQRLEAERQKGKFSLEDPLSPEDRATWNTLHRKRQLEAAPTGADNSRRLAIMGIAPQDRSPEQQEEYLRLRYQFDTNKYATSGGKAKTITGAKPGDDFAGFKTRLQDQQYSREDSRYAALTKEGTDTDQNKYDQAFIDRYKQQQADRQSKILADAQTLDEESRTTLSDTRVGLAKNTEVLSETKTKAAEYQASDRFKEDEKALTEVEQKKQEADFEAFVQKNVVGYEKQGGQFTSNDFQDMSGSWAKSQPGFDKLTEDEQKQLALGYEKKISDYVERPQADRQAELQALKSKPGYEGLSDSDALEKQRQEKNLALDAKSASMRQDIDKREFGDIPQLDPNASAANIDKIKEQSRAYAAAADKLEKVKNVDSSKQIEDYRKRAAELTDQAAAFSVSGNATETTQQLLAQTKAQSMTSGDLSVQATQASASAAMSDKGVEQFGAAKAEKEKAEVAKRESEERAAATQAAAEQRVREEQQASAQAQAKASADAEQARQDGMWVNSKQTGFTGAAVRGLGWFGGVAESGVRAARGATTAAVGATMNAVSQTGVVDWATGGSEAAAKGKELDAKIKVNQADQARRGVLGAAGTDQQAALKDAQSKVDEMAATQATASGDAFRSVANDAVVAGLQDVANVANAVTAGGAEQLLNQAGGNLGTNIFGRYGDPSAVSQMNEKNSRMLKDMGMEGSAFVTDFANTTAALAFEAIPIVASFGAGAAGSAASVGSKGTSLLSKAGKALSYADNLVSSPGSMVGMGKKALGAVDNVVTGGRGAKALKSVTQPFVATAQDIGQAGRATYDFAKPALSAAGRIAGDAMPSFRGAARGIGQGLSDFAGGARMVGDEMMNTLNNPMEALRFTGRSLDQEFTGGAIGRAGSKVINTAKETANAVGTRVSKEAKVFSSGLNKDITDVVDRLPGSGRARQLSPGSNTGTVRTIIDRNKKAKELGRTRAGTLEQRAQDYKTKKWFEEQDASDLADQKAYDEFMKTSASRTGTTKNTSKPVRTDIFDTKPLGPEEVAFNKKVDDMLKQQSNTTTSSASTSAKKAGQGRGPMPFSRDELESLAKSYGMSPAELVARMEVGPSGTIRIGPKPDSFGVPAKPKISPKETAVVEATSRTTAQNTTAVATRGQIDDSLLGAPISQADRLKLGLGTTEAAPAKAAAATRAKNKEVSKLIGYTSSSERAEALMEGQRAFFGPIVKNKEELIEKFGGREALSKSHPERLKILESFDDQQAGVFDIGNREWQSSVNPGSLTRKDYIKGISQNSGQWDETGRIVPVGAGANKSTYRIGDRNLEELTQAYFDPKTKAKFSHELTNIQRRDILAKIEAESGSSATTTTAVKPKVAANPATRPPNRATPPRPVAVATKPPKAAPTSPSASTIDPADYGRRVFGQRPGEEFIYRGSYGSSIEDGFDLTKMGSTGTMYGAGVYGGFDVSKVGQGKALAQSYKEQYLLKFIRENPGVSATEIAQQFKGGMYKLKLKNPELFVDANVPFRGTREEGIINNLLTQSGIDPKKAKADATPIQAYNAMVKKRGKELKGLPANQSLSQQEIDALAKAQTSEAFAKEGIPGMVAYENRTRYSGVDGSGVVSIFDKNAFEIVSKEGTSASEVRGAVTRARSAKTPQNPTPAIPKPATAVATKPAVKPQSATPPVKPANPATAKPQATSTATATKPKTATEAPTQPLSPRASMVEDLKGFKAPSESSQKLVERLQNSILKYEQSPITDVNQRINRAATISDLRHDLYDEIGNEIPDSLRAKIDSTVQDALKENKIREIADPKDLETRSQGWTRRTDNNREGLSLREMRDLEQTRPALAQYNNLVRPAEFAEKLPKGRQPLKSTNAAPTPPRTSSPTTMSDSQRLADLDAQIAALRGQEKKGNIFGFGKVSKEKEIGELLAKKRSINAAISRKEIMTKGAKNLEIERQGLGASFSGGDDEWKRLLEGGIPNEYRTYGVMSSNINDEAELAFGRLRRAKKQSQLGIKGGSDSNEAALYNGNEGYVFDPKTGKQFQSTILPKPDPEFPKSNTDLDLFEMRYKRRVSDFEKPYTSRGQAKPTAYSTDITGGIRIHGMSSSNRFDTLYNIPADEVTPELLEKIKKLGIQRFNKGGIVYANNGALIEARPQGPDTVPAMLTPGEFVINRNAAQKHMPVLQAINRGYYNQGGIVQYLAQGGIVAPQYHNTGGMVAPNYYAAGDVVKRGLSIADPSLNTGELKADIEKLAGAVEKFGGYVNTHVEAMDNAPRQINSYIESNNNLNVFGINNAEQRYAKQFDGKMEQVSMNHVAVTEQNRAKFNETAPVDSTRIIGRQDGLMS